MKSIAISCAAIVALHCTIPALAADEAWSSDFAAAKKQAAESKKDLLMDFTGSDWCGWCIKLKDEVFKHDAFNAGVKDNFVLVELDYPRDKTKLSEETVKQNEELGKKYAVQGYPTILLADSEGRPYAKTGYREGGPEKYVAHLDELRGKKTARDEAFAAAEKAEGVEKAKALVAALTALELNDRVVALFYDDVVQQIKAADPKDESGFLKKAAAEKRMAEFQATLQGHAENDDLDGALVFVEKTLKDEELGEEEKLQVMMTRALILAQQKKFEEAVKAVDEAKEASPDSPMMEGINGFRERLVGEMNKSKEAPSDEEEAAATEDDEEEAAEDKPEVKPED